VYYYYACAVGLSFCFSLSSVPRVAVMASKDIIGKLHTIMYRYLEKFIKSYENAIESFQSLNGFWHPSMESLVLKRIPYVWPATRHCIEIRPISRLLLLVSQP